MMHRRPVTFRTSNRDFKSQARCTRPAATVGFGRECMDSLCPAHYPAEYAEHLARHCPDSLPIVGHAYVEVSA